MPSSHEVKPALLQNKVSQNDGISRGEVKAAMHDLRQQKQMM
jgi:hypothetical protein